MIIKIIFFGLLGFFYGYIFGLDSKKKSKVAVNNKSENNIDKLEHVN